MTQDTETQSRKSVKKTPGAPSITEKNQIEKYQLWHTAMLHLKPYIEYKNNNNKKLINLYRNVVKAMNLEIKPTAFQKQFERGPLVWVRDFKKMTSDSNSGAARISFTDITGLKYFDEIDNMKLVQGYVEILGQQKKYDNSGKEPTSPKNKPQGNERLQLAKEIKDNQMLVWNYSRTPNI